MAVKTEISDKDFIEILFIYRLGSYRSSQPITSGAVQTNYLLETTAGKYVFRYYENRSKESVLFESHLIQYLKDRNYPCPSPYKNKHGKFVGMFQHKPYVIFEFIEGRHIENPSEDQKRQLIQWTAELQNLTRNYRPAYKEYRWNYSVELCRELARDAARKINTPNANEKRIWLEGELQELSLPQSLPKGICHCDFHFSNVLFKDGKFRALIDFDDANYTYLTFDLATLIEPFRKEFDWDTWSNFSKDMNVFDFREGKIIAAEYQKHRPLSSSEKRHLFDACKLSILFDCIWYFSRGDAQDFYEKRKIDYLNHLGRDRFYQELCL